MENSNGLKLKHKMLISIIIPAYNAEKYLDGCLSSCYRQDLPVDDYEIIIINDGSTDKTLSLAQKWASDYSNIRIISQKNKGLSEARNAGIDNAEGDYIMFLDSDDHIADNCLSWIVRNCRENKLDMYRICAANVIEGKAVRRFTYGITEISKGCELLKGKFQVCAPFAVYSKDFLLKNSLRFYPGIFHEDNLFTPIAYYMAEKVGTSNDIVYYVRQTPDSITRSANPKRSTDMLKVAGLLDEYASRNVAAGYRKYFEKQIADCLNGCFRNTCNLNDDDRKNMEATLYENRSLLRHFLRSSALTHKIEGLLLTMFPRHILSIYKMLDIIH